VGGCALQVQHLAHHLCRQYRAGKGSTMQGRAGSGKGSVACQGRAAILGRRRRDDKRQRQGQGRPCSATSAWQNRTHSYIQTVNSNLASHSWQASQQRTAGSGGLQVRHKVAAPAVLPLLSLLQHKHHAPRAGVLQHARQGQHGQQAGRRASKAAGACSLFGRRGRWWSLPCVWHSSSMRMVQQQRL
jgi:hypothetical protein